MKLQELEKKEYLFLPSLESDIEQMLQKKFNVSRDDFDHDEWRDLMTRCYGAIEDSKYDEIFDNIRHEAANFLMIRSFQKCAAHV